MQLCDNLKSNGEHAIEYKFDFKIVLTYILYSLCLQEKYTFNLYHLHYLHLHHIPIFTTLHLRLVRSYSCT